MTQEERIAFANRLKQLRAFEGATQEELSQKLNVSRSCLANYETCRREPHEDMIRSIAEYFGVCETYLTGGAPAAIAGSEEDIDSAALLSEDGQLDISDISIAGKIALIEFYHYLNDRAKEGAKAEVQKQAGK